LGYQYQVKYKKGADNSVADALSRQESTQELNASSTSTPKWLEFVIEGYQQDEQTKQLLAELCVTGSNDKGFSVTEGIIRYKGRIWLGNHIEVHEVVLQTYTPVC
jgi:RNase adaptor protein for sRNA GlmZ degradation